jgi:hypothetical protein
MNSIQVTLAPTATHVRVLMTGPEGEMMRAILGAPARMHPKAARTMLEGLALWQQQPLCVVLYVDEPDDGCAMGLYDGLGMGDRTLHYEVGIAVKGGGRRRRRLGSVGNFRDLRQLASLDRVSP